MTFVYAFLMVGITVTAVTAILIYRKLSSGPPDPTDTAEAIRRLEAATARISQQSETVTGIEPAQP